MFDAGLAPAAATYVAAHPLVYASYALDVGVDARNDARSVGKRIVLDVAIRVRKRERTRNAVAAEITLVELEFHALRGLTSNV